MATREAPQSNTRHNNQKGFFKGNDGPRDQNKKPAWELAKSTCDDTENQVIPFHIENDDDDEYEAKAAHSSDESDSENEDDPKNVSVACSEWLSAAAAQDEPDVRADAKETKNDKCESDRSEAKKIRVPPIEIKSEKSSNQTGDVEFSPLRAYSGTILIEGSIVRCNSGANRLAPQYQFFIKNKLVLLAQKQLNNRTSNYHIFDMSRGCGSGQKLNKKSGNYVGKLRSSFSKHENVMVSAQAERSELGAILFESKISNAKPRKLTIVCPQLSSENEIIPHAAKHDVFSSLLEQHKSDKRVSDGLIICENKEPEYEKGCYRLNFNGRVSIPSVKNFQLIVRGNASKGIVLQFGKVSDKLFHLDFKAPLTPFQAFAVALSQFNY